MNTNETSTRENAPTTAVPPSMFGEPMLDLYAGSVMGLTVWPHRLFTQAVWSGSQPIPPIGGRVNVIVNGFGVGTVVAYFINTDENGTAYLGVEVLPDVRPDWHIKQEGDARPHCCMFGAELGTMPTPIHIDPIMVIRLTEQLEKQLGEEGL